MVAGELYKKDGHFCGCSHWIHLQEETAENLLFDCEALEQLIFTVFGLVSMDSGILQENMAGGNLKYWWLMDLAVV